MPKNFWEPLDDPWTVQSPSAKGWIVSKPKPPKRPMLVINGVPTRWRRVKIHRDRQHGWIEYVTMDGSFYANRITDLVCSIRPSGRTLYDVKTWFIQPVPYFVVAVCAGDFRVKIT